jgi:hypothetical protein
MPSSSGYSGVRQHGKRWQAKDATGVHGTFADPYEAACALATAQGKPPPPRKPNAEECGRTAQQHIAALTTVLLAVPADQMTTVLANAMLAAEQERPQRTQLQPTDIAAPAPATDAVQATEPPAVPIPPLTANEQRRVKRMNAIADWWRSLWVTGETFHLKIERPRLLHHFETAEATRLAGQPREYDAMDSATLVKLLKELIEKKNGEVSRRPEGGGNPVTWWEIDAATYCPEELKAVWAVEQRRRRLAVAEAQRQRHVREKAARAEQKVRDEQQALQEKAHEEEEEKIRKEEWNDQVRLARPFHQALSMSVPLEEVEDDEEEMDDDYDEDDNKE